MNAKIVELNKVIDDIVAEYQNEVNVATVEVIRDVATDTVNQLKQTSPKDTGSYAKTWRFDPNIKKSWGVYSTYVFNRGNYQLTHLLEYGHDLIDKNGVKYGRVDAKPHIGKAEKFAMDKYSNELKRRLNDIK